MNKNEFIGMMVGIGFTLLVLTAYVLTFGMPFVDNSCEDIKQVLYYESLEIDITNQVTEIYDYYSLASNSYDYSDYTDVIFYCEKSRTLSQSYSQELREIKAEYPEDPIEILELRKEMIETEIDYLFALYQACEYIESASRAYDNFDYVMSDLNIDAQNEQIELHDNLIEDYYNLEAKYQKLKRELVV